MRDYSSFFQDFNESHTEILSCVRSGIGYDYINISGFRFPTSITKVRNDIVWILPSAYLINSTRSDFLTSISNDSANLLNFRSGNLVFIEFFIILYSDLLNSGEHVPSTFNNVVQTSPPTIKIPLSRSMRPTSPYTPEQLQSLKFRVILQLRIFFERS